MPGATEKWRGTRQDRPYALFLPFGNHSLGWVPSSWQAILVSEWQTCPQPLLLALLYFTVCKRIHLYGKIYCTISSSSNAEDSYLKFSCRKSFKIRERNHPFLLTINILLVLIQIGPNPQHISCLYFSHCTSLEYLPWWTQQVVILTNSCCLSRTNSFWSR